LAGILVGLVVGPLGGLRVGLMVALMVGFVLELGLGLVGALWGGFWGRDPRSLTIRWPTRKDLASGLAVWFGVGLVLVLVLVLWLKLWLGVALGLGLLLKFMNVSRIPLAATLDATPRLLYRKDVQSQLMGGLLLALVGGLLFGLVAGLGYEPDHGLVDRLVHGLVDGLLFGLVGGLVFGLSGGAASSLLFTEIALWLRGRRVRFVTLLETALARQVLRQAGGVYQFRHADLQDRLAHHYEAGLTREPAV
jgi:hypothetical protein